MMPCGCAIAKSQSAPHYGDMLLFCPLHSAAPELLEALKHSECAACGAMHGDEEMYPGQNCSSCREARAAILKAEGMVTPAQSDAPQP